MKNLYIIIITTITISFTACSTLNSGSSTKSSKEQMLMDATAMASIECEYNLLQLRLEDDGKDFNLQSQFKSTTQDLRALSRLLYKRYDDSTGLRPQFKEFVKSAKSNLTICLQLQEYEEMKAEETVENPDEDENVTKNYK